MVDSSHRSTIELVEVVEGLSFRDDDSPAAITESPDLVFLGSVKRAFYQHLPMTADPDAQIASYVARPDRHLTVTVTANEAANWSAHLHQDGYEAEQVGGLSAYVVRHDDFTQLIWLEGQSLVTVGAVGMSDDEIDAAIAGLYSTTETTSAGSIGTAEDESTASLPELVDAEHLQSDGIPDGFELVVADHRDLGDGTLTTTDVLLFDVTAARTIRFEINEDGTDHAAPEGKTTDVGGVAVTHTTGLVENIAVYDHDGRSVKVTAGLTSELLLTLVDDVLDTDLSPSALGRAASTSVMSTRETMTWLADDGRAVTGPADAASATYVDEATGASISISSQPTDRSYPVSVLHSQSASIDLGTVDGVLSPAGTGWKIEFVVAGRLVTVTGNGVETQELLPVISGLRTVDPDQ